MRAYCNRACRIESSGKLTEVTQFQMQKNAAFLSLQLNWSEGMCHTTMRSMKNSGNGFSKRVSTHSPSVGSNALRSGLVLCGKLFCPITGRDSCEMGTSTGGNSLKEVNTRRKAAHGLEATDARLAYICKALQKVEKYMESFVQNKEMSTVTDIELALMRFFPEDALVRSYIIPDMLKKCTMRGKSNYGRRD